MDVTSNLLTFLRGNNCNAQEMENILKVAAGEVEIAKYKAAEAESERRIVETLMPSERAEFMRLKLLPESERAGYLRSKTS